MAKNKNENKEKVEIEGNLPRAGAQAKQVYFNLEVLDIINSEFKFESISTLVNFLVLHYDGKVDLRKEKIVNVYDLKKYLNKK